MNLSAFWTKQSDVPHRRKNSRDRLAKKVRLSNEYIVNHREFQYCLIVPEILGHGFCTNFVRFHAMIERGVRVCFFRKS